MGEWGQLHSPFNMKTTTLDQEYPKPGYLCVANVEFSQDKLAGFVASLELHTGKSYLVVKNSKRPNFYLIYERTNANR